MAEALWREDDPPVTGNRQGINERQNEPEFLSLLCAAAAAHHQAQRWETLRWVGVVATAVLALVAASHPELQQAMSIAGVVAAVIITIVIPIPSIQHTTVAAMVQEDFDTRLFQIIWNDLLGKAPRGETIDDLASKFAGDISQKRDWYLNVSGLSRPYAILLCQRENLVWDFRQRKVWGLILAGATVVWVAIGIVIALGFDWTVRELFLRWFVPSSALIIAGSQEALAHLRIGQEKEGLALDVESRLAAAPAGNPDEIMSNELGTFTRQLQDRIADSRKKTPRVPSWFYERRRGSEGTHHLVGGARLRDRLIGSGEEGS
jgi:hypothetical protein